MPTYITGTYMPMQHSLVDKKKSSTGVFFTCNASNNKPFLKYNMYLSEFEKSEDVKTA